MKVLITGATGFIGEHLVRRMSASEHELVCLARATSNFQALEDLGVNLVIGDVTDKKSIVAAMEGCDWVVNLANHYSFWEPDPGIYTRVNVHGTRNVMEAALETGVRKVVHMSTALIYGNPQDAPFREDSPVGALRFSKYAESKYQGSLIAWNLYEETGLPLVVLYPSGVLGPGDDKFTGQYIQIMMRGGMPARAWESAVHNLVHVKDVVEATYRALQIADNIGEKYLISGYQVTLGELNRMISEISGEPLPRLVFPDWLAMASAWTLTKIADLVKKPPLWNMMLDGMRNLQAGINFDGSKAERELGLTYTPIRMAVQDAIESYR